MPNDRRDVSGAKLFQAVGYGARVASFLRPRLGYCAHKKLAGLLDISTRQAERLLQVSATNRGPTVEQLLLLYNEYGEELLRAVFVEAAQRRDERLESLAAERKELDREIAERQARLADLERELRSASFRLADIGDPGRFKALLTELVAELRDRHPVPPLPVRLLLAVGGLFGGRA